MENEDEKKVKKKAKKYEEMYKKKALPSRCCDYLIQRRNQQKRIAYTKYTQGTDMASTQKQRLTSHSCITCRKLEIYESSVTKLRVLLYRLR